MPTAFELDLCTDSLITLSLSADAALRATIIGFYTSLLSCYDDQIYIPPADRKPGKVLHVFDMGEAEKPARYAVASCSVRLTEEAEPVSLLDLLKKAHRRNLVGFSEEAAEEEALAIAKHALGCD